jgi:hypothetical protein
MQASSALLVLPAGTGSFPGGHGAAHGRCQLGKPATSGISAFPPWQGAWCQERIRVKSLRRRWMRSASIGAERKSFRFWEVSSLYEEQIAHI